MTEEKENIHAEIPGGALVSDDNGLVFACLLDRQGGASVRDWEGIETWSPDQGHLWMHLNRASSGTQRWLTEDAKLSDIAVKALLEEETRPRVFTSVDGIVAILRGVNFNAGAEPDDMVALRLCVSGDRLITVRHRPLLTPRDMLSDLVDKRTGPSSAPELFVRLAERLTERMNWVVVELDEKLDSVEEKLDEEDFALLRKELTDIRQTAVGLRRYIGPQREALARIQIERPAWLDRELEGLLRESAEKLQRYIEDLDAARDRAMVIRDEISNRLAEDTNRTMYALAIVAGVFLPLSFLTGLLGINVGGMPGVESSWAFWITCVLLMLVLTAELYLFRRLRWI